MLRANYPRSEIRTLGRRSDSIGRGVSLMNFSVTHNKLGVGRGGLCSEASLLTHDSSEMRFAVAWQNLVWRRQKGFRPITMVVEETIENYLKAARP
jgi:hypothetical protein